MQIARLMWKCAFQSPVSPVGNMTFTLLKTGQYNYTTVMYVGTKVHFQLQIQFPPGTMDLLVELFTPDNATTIMDVCNPQIVWVGQNIHFDQSQAQPVMDSLGGSLNVSTSDFFRTNQQIPHTQKPPCLTITTN